MEGGGKGEWGRGNKLDGHCCAVRSFTFILKNFCFCKVP